MKNKNALIYRANLQGCIVIAKLINGIMWWFRKSLNCQKLSNSGNALKLLVLSYNRNIVCLWGLNISARTVIIHKMVIRDLLPTPGRTTITKIKLGIYLSVFFINLKVNSIGYLGSKIIKLVSCPYTSWGPRYEARYYTLVPYLGTPLPLELKCFIIKEQRIYGNWLIIIISLIYILMGFERNYQFLSFSEQFYYDYFYTSWVHHFSSPSGHCPIRHNPARASWSFNLLTPYSHLLSPTNLNIINYYSTFAKNNENLNDYWITGFVDGEGSFMIIFVEDQRRKTGWRVYLCFAISLHKKDEVILRKIKKSLGGVGTITSKGHSGVHLRVTDLKGIDKLIKHFDKFPLITQKRADAELFKKVYQFMENKEHLTREGLRKIVALKDKSNHGLSDKLKKAFPDFVPVSRPIVMNQIIEDPNWLTGFTTAEGCYYIDIYRSKSNKLGFVVRLVFSIGQHKRDEALLISFIYYLNCGTVNKNKDICVFRVTKFDDIINKIIPLFNNNLILGVKAEDFNDFCKVAEMMKKKEHLTLEGLEKIKKIKAGMNRGRKWD